MATYTFIAYDQDGLRVCGVKSYPNEEIMKAYLNKRDLQNYTVFTSKTRYVSKHYHNATAKELSIFCRQMSVLFFSQITLMEGVLLLSEQTENKELKTALGEIYGHMSQGRTFAEAMGMYEHIFGSYLLNMVFIGEASGTLDNIFARMSSYFDKENKTKKKLKSAVTYPAILTVLMTAIVLLLILRILPMFQETLYNMGGEIPDITKAILAVSDFIGSYLVYIVLLIIAVIGFFVFWGRTEKGAAWFAKMKVSVPVSRFIFSRIITARFARSLAILLKSGVQLLNAMDDVKSLIANQEVEKKYTNAMADVKKGKDLSGALKGLGIFPPLFLKMVSIGQTTGHLDEMLDKSADIFDEEVDEALERLTVMIEPVLIIILSVIVGIILLSVMLPMISIMNTIG